MKEILVFYITHPNKGHAERIVKQLMQDRLIACGNVFPITSDYIWKGAHCSDEEYVSILKTRKTLEEKVETRLNELHEYDTVCILRTEFRCNAKYAKWIKEQTKS